MPKKATYVLIDTHIHRIAKLTGDLVREKEAYIRRMNDMIKELMEARQEVLRLVGELDETEGGSK